MASINDPRAPALPSFANLGVITRILLVVNAIAFAAAFARSASLSGTVSAMQDLAVYVEPVLLVSLLVLYGLDRWLGRLPYSMGVAAILGAVTLLALAQRSLLAALFPFEPAPSIDRVLLSAWAMAGLTLWVLYTRSRILSPAVTEARLAALQARIRPHFLFNSINAVMSLVRSDPARAERALLDLADLFRVLMRENRELTTLEAEVNLSWQYIELEHLRLGDRLRVLWHIDKMPKDALVPPLLLQPLLENAVYHGIEPRLEPGEIVVNIYRHRGEVHLVVKNPCPSPGSEQGGNRMAMHNIRERLALHFDAEATMTAERVGDTFQVHIVLPYRRARP